MNYTKLNQVYQGLCRIRDEGPPDPECGICNNLNIVLDEMYGVFYDQCIEHWLRSQFSKWEHFSGLLLFPVPSTDPDLSCSGMYSLATNMWGKKAEYGGLRWNLLEFLIKQAKQELEAWRG